VYRPTYIATFRAAIDANNNVTAIHVKGGGIPEHAVHENRFPAGAFENYLAEGWEMPSNITIGAFRAPRSNFIASAEQSFLDELAEAIGKDPIDYRIELLKRAKSKPVGKNNEYDADRYIGVLELVRQKSGWGKDSGSKARRGVAAYFCHNSYAAHVVDIVMKDGQPLVNKVVSAMDCGVLVNPEGARNMVEGAVVDGIGNALFGGLKFEKGEPKQRNFPPRSMCISSRTTSIRPDWESRPSRPSSLPLPMRCTRLRASDITISLSPARRMPAEDEDAGDWTSYALSSRLHATEQS
jgi:isoquinoline 1-oxidoreductase beta subunit